MNPIAVLPLKIDRGHYKPKVNKRGLKKSDLPCSYVTTSRSLHTIADGVEKELLVKLEKKPCSHRSYWYIVNHLRVSLCICHASRFSKKKALRVIAA